MGYTLLIVLLFHVGRDPKYWKDPEEFIPNRWTDDNGKNPLNGTNFNKFSWVPFSAGSRNCIGQRFAMIEMKVVLSYLLKFFEVKNVMTKEELEQNLMSAIILRSKEKL